MTIKAIIFDFGQVLATAADPQANVEHRTRLAAQLNLGPDELWPYIFGGELARQWMSGEIADSEFWPAILIPRGITDKAGIADFAENIFDEPIQIDPEMASVLYELAPNYRLAVLSNATWTVAELTAILENDLNLPAGLFTCIMTSTSAGVAKPDPAFFRLALEKVSAQPDETVFIDDIELFTDAAAQLGIHSHTFTTPAALRVFLAEKNVL